jgi:hypothetical protein
VIQHGRCHVIQDGRRERVVFVEPCWYAWRCEGTRDAIKYGMPGGGRPPEFYLCPDNKSASLQSHDKNAEQNKGSCQLISF